MERHRVLDMMRTLRLSGMRAAYDEIVAQGIKREHPIQRVVGDLLKLEIADKQARSIKYQLTIAKLPMVKELADFDFASSLDDDVGPYTGPKSPGLRPDGFRPRRGHPASLRSITTAFPENPATGSLASSTNPSRRQKDWARKLVSITARRSFSQLQERATASICASAATP